MTVKPRYDSDGSWKRPEFNDSQWKALQERIQNELRPFYPDKKAETDPTFGHPADAWANGLLDDAYSAVSLMLSLRRRLTNAELRVEQSEVLKTLKKADKCLSTLSHDLDIMLGVDADVLGCRNKIRELIPRVEAANTNIAKLPKAKKLGDAQHAAAVEMAIRVLRALNRSGIQAAATAGTYMRMTDINKIAERGAADTSRYVSDAVKILKAIGDALGLRLGEVTWRNTISKAKKAAADIQ